MLRKETQFDSESFYEVLGICRDANETAIERAYNDLANELQSQAQTEESSRIIRKITEAKNALLNPETRLEHDSHLDLIQEGGRPERKLSDDHPSTAAHSDVHELQEESKEIKQINGSKAEN